VTARDELYAYATVAFRGYEVPEVVDRHVNRLIDAFRAEVLAEAGWVPCSPEWLAAHPNECGTAPRLPGAPDLSHWHPATEVPAPVASDRCGRCVCADCGGRLDQHREGGCGCGDCTSAPDLACTAFVPDPTIGCIASQLDSLLSSHLHEAARLRCLVVAHAAHHALTDYDKEN
jgi:hypothetical protein